MTLYTSSARRTAILLLLLSTLCHAQKKCYLMNGDESPAHQPCRPDDDHSACCALNNADPSTNDICLSSGLCLSSNNLIYESACTDITWESDACPSLCPDKTTKWRGDANGDWTPGESRLYWQVMTCASGTVCCRASGAGESCCEEDLMKEFVVGQPVYPGSTIVPISEATATTTTTTTTVTSTTTTEGAGPTCEPVASGCVMSGDLSGEPECSSKEVTVGAAVGATLGAALIGALAALLFTLRRQKKLLETLESYNMAQTQQQLQQPVMVREVVKGPVELGHFAPKYELGTER